MFPWLQEGNAHSSHEDLVTLTEIEVGFGKKCLASVCPGQSDDLVVEHVEREASQFSFEIGLEEVVPTLEEIPSVIQLNALQLWELVLLVLGAESVVGGCRGDDCGHADGTSDELDVFNSN